MAKSRNLTPEQKAAAHRTYTQEQIDLVLSLRREGVSLADISLKTGVSKGACRFYFSRYGVVVTKEQASRNLKRLTKEQEDLVVELRKQGADRRQIAEKVGISLSSVKDILKKQGIVLTSELISQNVQKGKTRFYERYVNEVLPAIAAQCGTVFVGPYLGSSKKTEWRCSVGHVFSRRPNDALCHGAHCPQCAPKSRPQVEVYDFVRKYCPDAVLNDRTVLAPKEADIYVPSRKLVLEFNGLFWHSEASPSFATNADRDKAEKCRSQGLSYFMIFEDEWAQKRELVKAMIKQRLGVADGTRLNARDLSIKEISSVEARAFLERNHIDGAAQASWGLALFDVDKMVSVATVRRGLAREWELARFACDYDFVVRGAAGRLVSAICKKLAGASLVTYSNNRIGAGDVYRKLGFREITESRAPNYWYTDCGGHRVSRHKCQRVNDPGVLAKYPTEKEQAAGGVFSAKVFGDNRPLFRIEDCGNRKWILESRDNHEQQQHCDKPPDGWRCTRKRGHEGPCAAIPSR